MGRVVWKWVGSRCLGKTSLCLAAENGRLEGLKLLVQVSHPLFFDSFDQFQVSSVFRVSSMTVSIPSLSRGQPAS